MQSGGSVGKVWSNGAAALVISILFFSPPSSAEGHEGDKKAPHAPSQLGQKFCDTSERVLDLSGRVAVDKHVNFFSLRLEP